MISFIIFPFLFVVVSSITISTQKVTNWGEWGEMERCPNNTYVIGMQLKVEDKQGELADDTALNGVKFFCSSIGGILNKDIYITSKVGYWGEWKSIISCLDNSVVIGLSMRIEDQRFIIDDTSANNIKIFCSDGLLHEGDGLNWGKWNHQYYCPKRYAVCAIKTQVEGITNNDDTALNNIDFKCCEIPSPASTCKPTDRWELIGKCYNELGSDTKICDIKGLSRGYFWTGSGTLRKVYENIGYKFEDQLHYLMENFEKSLGRSDKTNIEWNKLSISDLRTNSNNSTYSMKALPNSKRYLYRLVAKCGPYLFKTGFYQETEEQMPIDSLYFD